MQWIARIDRFRVTRPGVMSPHHLKPASLDQAKQLLATTQAQMLGQIRQNQPGLTLRVQVRSHRAQKTSEHGAVIVIDTTLKG